MNIGILLPGFSASEDDWAIPVQQNLVRELATTDDIRVIALRYPHTRLPYTVNNARVYPLGVGAWTRGFRRLRLWWDAIRLIRRLHRQQPFDALHAMWADETGLITAWAGRLLGIQTVVSVAGGELVSFSDLDYGLQRSRFSRWIVGQALTVDAVVVACTYAKKRIYTAGYRVPETKIHTITLGVDTDVFQPSDEVPTSNHLIHVASLVGVKDQSTLLRAIAQLEDVTLDIVGEGKERGQIEQLIQELDIADRVRIIGSVPHLELPQHYQRAALNILSSRHEGLGMVTLEAAACGVPTVSTNVGLLPDCPDMGITVPTGDVIALANAIRSLLNDPERLTMLRHSAREAVLQRYTIKHTAAHFRSLYQHLLGA